VGELVALNAKVLHSMPFEEVEERLSAIGVAKPIWEAVRGNITRLADAERWAQVINGVIDPVIEDKALAQAAANLVPNDIGDDGWAAFTEAVKEKTGAKGKKLFMPLRLALTGQAAGPEMAALFPLLGAEKARLRLRGERA
jgi:glutamyl-tRNA synthetase